MTNEPGAQAGESATSASERNPPHPGARLRTLANLLRRRNEIDQCIAALIQRPAERGHVGEFIAACALGVRLHRRATMKGSDGTFASGPLAGKTVNVKFYGKREGLLDLCEGGGCDYYLVFTGAVSVALSSVGATRPLCIEAVYLFDARALHEDLTKRNRRIGVASSIRRAAWDSAQVFPRSRSDKLPLTDEQIEQLRLFSAECLAPRDRRCD